MSTDSPQMDTRAHEPRVRGRRHEGPWSVNAWGLGGMAHGLADERPLDDSASILSVSRL